MVEVVVGKAQVGKVVADQTAVAVGFADVEGKAGKLNLAVGIGNVHGGFVDKSGFAPLPVLSLGGLAKVFQPWGEGKLEASVRAHTEAVAEKELLAERGSLEPRAEHLPAAHSPFHGGTAEAADGAVERYGLAKTA